MRLKPRNRSKAAEAAADSTPSLKGGACVSLFGQWMTTLSDRTSEASEELELLQAKSLSVRTKKIPQSLEHLLGTDCYLNLGSNQQAKVLDSKVVASLITYYAVEKGSKIALHSMGKFVSTGIDTWIQKITGYSEPNGTLELLNSINSTMGKLLVKVERLEEIETETMGYRKATVTLPVLQKWMEELSAIEKQKLLEPAEELLTIKEAMASLHPGCVFSQTLHKKLALKVGQTITALSDKPNVKGFNMAVNGYTKAQLPLIKLCLQSIMGEF